MNDTYNDFTRNFFKSKIPQTKPFEFENNYNLFENLGYSPLDAQYDIYSKNSFKWNPNNEIPNSNSSFFTSKGFNNAMSGLNIVGGLAGVVGGVLAAREQKKFNKKILALEEQQRQRIYAREDANNKALNQGINAFFKQKKDNL